MKLAVKGAPGLPVVLLIHPELSDWTFFEGLCDELGVRYRVALPTLSGHYSGSAGFVSSAEDARTLRTLLRDSEVEQIRVLVGCGVGAQVGLEFVRDAAPGAVRRCVFSGAALTNGRIARAAKLHEMRSLAQAARKNPETASRRVDTHHEAYARCVAKVAARMDGATLAALADACCAYAELPPLNRARQGSTTFLWGSYDPACKAAERVRRAYPYAQVEVATGLEAYADLLGDPAGFARRHLA